MTEARVILVTVPSHEEGERMAEALVGERLAACVHLIGPIRSVYRWQGKLCRDDEHLLFIKTTRDRYASLEARVLDLHPYEVPEVISLPVEDGAESYLSWLRDQTRSG